MAVMLGITQARSKPDTTVYDPTGGSGSLLLKAAGTRRGSARAMSRISSNGRCEGLRLRLHPANAQWLATGVKRGACSSCRRVAPAAS